ncbi:UNVERIFIED_CONTAM: Glycosyltransferase 6 [Sesamum calycinum]|uniref:Glycosyltransferase 6 n=1 Tax=Sesamum calycinum TaxID=2727403 RepID=A0AAW2SVJ7_9LAMI
MASTELSQSQNFSMAKNNGRSKPRGFLSDGVIFCGGALVAFLVVWAFWSFFSPSPSPTPSFSTSSFKLPHASETSTSAAASSTCAGNVSRPNPLHDPPEPNFYDDPELSYRIDSPVVKNWEEEEGVAEAAPRSRRRGRESDPNAQNVLILGQNSDGESRHGGPPGGGVDLVGGLRRRLHGHGLQAPIGPVQGPQSGDPRVANLIYEKQSWTSINAGVFLIRNCQWAMDFMDVWARMGPQTPDYDKWGEILRTTFKDKIFPESDDQSGLVYLLLKEKEKWGEKIYVESEYYFEGYWMEIVGKFDNITRKYMEIEKEVGALRRRHAEKVSGSYGRVWEEYLKEAGYGRESWRRPFITHFTGCQPCSGDHNQMYSGQTCFDAMQKALTFADNQVLRNYGFVHPDLLDPSTVDPLPFDYPA